MTTIGVETLTPDLFAELRPLSLKCWAESTTVKAETCAFHGERDFEIEPDYDAYQKLADGGALVVVTLRHDKVLVGYVVGFAYRALHHKALLGGIVDTAYIEPEFRSYAPVAVKRFEKEMRKRDVAIIGWPTHEKGPIFALLKSMGYAGDDIVMEKRLCV